jgi:hypothetical protein
MRAAPLLLVVCAVGQVTAADGGAAVAADAPVVLRGSWRATSGARVFAGLWSAQVQPGTPDEAVGSWSALGPDGQVALDGTWSANKQPRAWRGTWAARTRQGVLYRGTWEADPRNLVGKTFEDMLRQTGNHRIGGTWRSGRSHGNWWLEAEPHGN